MKKIMITITIDKDLLEKFDKVAKDDCRTRTNLIIKLMKEIVEENKEG